MGSKRYVERRYERRVSKNNKGRMSYARAAVVRKQAHTEHA